MMGSISKFIYRWLYQKIPIYRSFRQVERRIDIKKRRNIAEIGIDDRKSTTINKLYEFLLFLRKFSIYRWWKSISDPNDEFFHVEECYAKCFFVLLLILVFIGPLFYFNKFFLLMLSLPCIYLCPFVYLLLWIYCVFFFFLLFIPIYRILDLFVAHLNILLLHSDRGRWTRSEDGYIIIRHAQRWVVFLFADFLQIVLSFAVIYWVIDILYYYDYPPPFKDRFIISIPVGFEESLKIGINALYFSLVTIVTLGYGDFSPTAPIWRLVVSVEILIGLFFLFFVFVIAVPTIRTKIDVTKKWKNKR